MYCAYVRRSVMPVVCGYLMCSATTQIHDRVDSVLVEQHHMFDDYLLKSYIYAYY